MFQPLTPQLIPSCAIELVAAFKEAPWFEYWTIEQASMRIQEIMSSPYARGYVILEDDRVIAMTAGHIMTYMDTKEFWIDEFSVHPEYQHRHLGTKLMTYLRVKLKNEGVQYLKLNTHRGYSCVNFYKYHNFKEDEDMLTMYKTL